MKNAALFTTLVLLVAAYLLIYVVGSFIALDFNILHWDAITCLSGRIIFTLFMIIVTTFILGLAIEEDSENRKQARR